MQVFLQGRVLVTTISGQPVDVRADLLEALLAREVRGGVRGQSRDDVAE